VTTTLVLASASPARRAVLRAAGVEPVVRVSDVDEDAVAAALPPDTAPEQVVVALARAKARAVAALAADGPDCVVVGCDSMLLLDGVLQGKPHTAEVARARWAAMAGRTGTLLTGHCVLRVPGALSLSELRKGSTRAACSPPPHARRVAIDTPLTRNGSFSGEHADVSAFEPCEAVGCGSTAVRFGRPDADELDAYVATGEPLQVAGAFTLDGLGGWFVEGVDGDPSSVIGIGLPLLRRLLREVGVDVTRLWTAAPE
jgi:septum formation protein